MKNLTGKLYIIVIVAAVIAGVIGWMQWFEDDPADSGHGDSALVIPALSAKAAMGAELFEQKCMACHGQNAAGSDQGPPLVHRIYEPNHHGDIAFRLAAQQGVRAHHWDFGNMPPVEDVSEDEVVMITRYVRELQKANGIY